MDYQSVDEKSCDGTFPLDNIEIIYGWKVRKAKNLLEIKTAT